MPTSTINTHPLINRCPSERRHHCRNCGKVFCGRCSNKEFLIPRLNPKPVRVCLTCHFTLAAEHPASPTGTRKFDVQMGDVPKMDEE